MQSSARDDRRLRLVDDDRHDRAFTEIGTAMSSGTGKFALMPSTRSISLTSSLTLAFAWLSTSLSFGPAIAWQVERLHPDLEVLDARDVHAADEQHVVGRLDDREHVRRRTPTAGRSRRDRRSPAARRRCSTISPGEQRVGRHRLDRRRQHEQPGRWRPCRPASAPARGRRTAPRRRRRARCSAAACRASPTTSPNCRSPSTSTTGSLERLRHRGGDVDRDAGLAHATLGGEHRDQATGLAGASRRRLRRGGRRRRRAARRRGRPTG